MFRISTIEMKNDRSYSFNAIARCPELLGLVGESLQLDREFLISLVKIQPGVISNAQTELIDDHVFLSTCLKENYRVFSLLPESVRNNGEFVLSYLANTAQTIYFSVFSSLGESLTKDASFMLKAVARFPIMLKFASDGLKNDRSFITSVIKYRISAMGCVCSHEIRNDKALAIQLLSETNIRGVKIGCSLLKYLSKSLKFDYDLCKLACKDT